MFPEEYECRGFVAKTITRLLKRNGVKGQASSEVTLSDCEAKQQLASERGLQLGCEMTCGVKAEGGKPGMPGVAVLWAYISETLKMEGAHLMTPMTL